MEQVSLPELWLSDPVHAHVITEVKRGQRCREARRRRLELLRNRVAAGNGNTPAENIEHVVGVMQGPAVGHHQAHPLPVLRRQHVAAQHRQVERHVPGLHPGHDEGAALLPEDLLRVGRVLPHPPVQRVSPCLLVVEKPEVCIRADVRCVGTARGRQVETPRLVVGVDLCAEGVLQQVARAPDDGATPEGRRPAERLVQGGGKEAHDPLAVGGEARQAEVARDVLLCDEKVPRGDVRREVHRHRAHGAGEVARLAPRQHALREVERLQGAKPFKWPPLNNRPRISHRRDHEVRVGRAVQEMTPVAMPVFRVDVATSFRSNTYPRLLHVTIQAIALVFIVGSCWNGNTDR
mmetsp:Transcript_32077/g.76236  ORF Transcript_32077/g.76236 Transcript_32077/m.76236 type:complete len:349 (-) Transcript_32077:518-1564(-)